MKQNPQDIARAMQAVMRLAGPRRSLGGIVAVLAIGLCIALLSPSLSDWLAPSGPNARPPAGQGGPQTPAPVPKPATEGVAVSDYLQEIGSQTYRSPEGLVYGRGSEHGHRLKHLMAHAADQPDRPGSHGVFDTQQAIDVLKLIDQGYALAKSGKQTRTRIEQGRTVYLIDMRRRIGYVGGESGARRGHPAASSLQLITDGDRFITAYPIQP